MSNKESHRSTVISLLAKWNMNPFVSTYLWHQQAVLLNRCILLCLRNITRLMGCYLCDCKQKKTKNRPLRKPHEIKIVHKWMPRMLKNSSIMSHSSNTINALLSNVWIKQGSILKPKNALFACLKMPIVNCNTFRRQVSF